MLTVIQPRNWPLGRVAAVLAALLLAACSVSGQSFNIRGLDQIVIGRTTVAQASDYLGAWPDQTWQQGDTLLARWAYKGSLATDAVYVRQEAWLRFGPDGTFQRMENTINIPGTYHPKTQEQADQAAAAQAAALQPPVSQSTVSTTQQSAAEQTAAPQAVTPDGPAISSYPAVPVDASGSGAMTQAVSTPQPLLPEGSVYIPGVSYPIGNLTRPQD